MKNNKKQRVLALLLGLSSMAQLPGNASAHKEKQQQVTESSVSDGVLNGYKGLTNRLGMVTDSLKSNPETLAYLKLLGLLAVTTSAGAALYKFTHRPTSLGPSLAYNFEKDIISDLMRNEAVRKAKEKENKKSKLIIEFIKDKEYKNEVEREVKEIFNEYTGSIRTIFLSSLEDNEKYSTCGRFFFKDENGNWYFWKIDIKDDFDSNKVLKYLQNNVLNSVYSNSNRPPENLPSISEDNSISENCVFHLNLVKDGYLEVNRNKVALVDTSTNEEALKRINDSGIECFFVFPSFVKNEKNNNIKANFRALLFSGSELKSSADFPFMINVNELKINSGKVPLKFARNTFNDSIKIPVANDVKLRKNQE